MANIYHHGTVTVLHEGKELHLDALHHALHTLGDEAQPDPDPRLTGTTRGSPRPGTPNSRYWTKHDERGSRQRLPRWKHPCSSGVTLSPILTNHLLPPHPLHPHPGLSTSALGINTTLKDINLLLYYSSIMPRHTRWGPSNPIHASAVQSPPYMELEPPPYSTIDTSPVNFAHNVPFYDTRFYTYENMIQTSLIDCSPNYTLPGPHVNPQTWNPDFEPWTEFIRRPPLNSLPAYTLGTTPDPRWPFIQPFLQRYPYTSSRGITIGANRDPNVLIAYQYCPILQCGSHCLDPYYNTPRNIANLSFGKTPDWGQRSVRRLRYRLTEQLLGTKGHRTSLLDDQKDIPEEWALCYYNHRDQRIMAKDPMLSIMENFILRMVKSKRYDDDIWQARGPTLHQPPPSYQSLNLFGQPAIDWSTILSRGSPSLDDIMTPPSQFDSTVTSSPIPVPRGARPRPATPTPTPRPPWRRPELHTLDLTANDRLLLNMAPEDSL